ncbi:MAG: pirin family protein [Pseudomonadales bacterium]
MKPVLGTYTAPPRHWVGDGFPVRSYFSYGSHDRHVSPFLLLDHAGPARFEPAEHRRGVGTHPHRGFETVTIVYAGEIEHQDSTGAGGRIGPGDVQWMTAGSGILHQEYHSDAFTRAGGDLEMVQLWVNLPAATKMTPPAYQTLEAADIPMVDLPDQAGSLRVIAGEFAGRAGPARTHTPLFVWDVRLNQGGVGRMPLTPGWTAMAVVLRGSVRVNGADAVRQGQFALLDAAAGSVTLEADTDAMLLLLGGEPIDEPLVGHGPFVMNTKAEIAAAFDDFRRGRFGRMAG